jgi:hypothetical protein
MTSSPTLKPLTFAGGLAQTYRSPSVASDNLAAPVTCQNTGAWSLDALRPDGAAPTVRSIPAQGKPASRAPPWVPSPKRLAPHRGARNRSLRWWPGTAASAAFPCTRSTCHCPCHLNPRRSWRPDRAHCDGAPDPGRRPRRGLALGWYPSAPLVRKGSSNVQAPGAVGTPRPWSLDIIESRGGGGGSARHAAAVKTIERGLGGL